MKIDLGSFAFGSSVSSGGNTPSWGTSLGQIKPDLKLTYPGYDNIVIGMVNKSIPVDKVFIPLGKGGHVCNSLEDEGILLAALFDKVYINEKKVNAPFIMLIYKESSDSWAGRKTLKYSVKIEYRRNKNDIVYNSDFIIAARKALHLTDNACWVISDMFILNQDELHMIAGIVNPNQSETYSTTELRKVAFINAIKTTFEENPHFKQKYFSGTLNESLTTQIQSIAASPYRPYITAIKSKPFLLLAGISGTGKSRIVRELARACWDEGSEEFEAQKPKNFEMVQVKPNWHDSSELIGYVSRIGVDKDGNPKPVFVAGEFLKFVARAWEEQDVPYFLCLDEMNLAPVEQYFAEYLSVVESRKTDGKGNITTDPILKKSKEDWYRVLTGELTDDDEVRNRFLEDGICIPQNLIVVGTVNMDETTFSFSRKVLDRAMTIEMNEVDLKVGLDVRYEQIGKLGTAELIGNVVEGVDIYSSYKDVCDTAINYLQRVNDKLEGTPFKVAYRTRNEVLLYVVNNLPYNKNEGDDESTYKEEFVIARALDEITNMKILSRIEGDESKVSEGFLNDLKETIKEGLESVFEELFEEDDDDVYTSVSLAKLDEMKKRLASGYTSFWS